MNSFLSLNHSLGPLAVAKMTFFKKFFKDIVHDSDPDEDDDSVSTSSDGPVWCVFNYNRPIANG